MSKAAEEVRLTKRNICELLSLDIKRINESGRIGTLYAPIIIDSNYIPFAEGLPSEAGDKEEQISLMATLISYINACMSYDADYGSRAFNMAYYSSIENHVIEIRASRERMEALEKLLNEGFDQIENRAQIVVSQQQVHTPKSDNASPVPSFKELASPLRGKHINFTKAVAAEREAPQRKERSSSIPSPRTAEQLGRISPSRGVALGLE
jgi:hypothetical protein